MRRSLRYMALGVLTASLLSGNALTALADQDVNHGPGVSQAPEVSQEAPGVSGDTTQNGPGIIVEPGSGTGGQESSQSETASPETETPAPEAGTEGQASGSPPGGKHPGSFQSGLFTGAASPSGYDLDRSHP